MLNVYTAFMSLLSKNVLTEGLTSVIETYNFWLLLCALTEQLKVSEKAATFNKTKLNLLRGVLTNFIFFDFV
ncbi:hypothetical protein MuYL_3245 [Mucilaginibacter xinganensis]|uniref:Uncharacterized protein n=1 Tax=Mucilaginibacter xinganensis TaxID=1234841 RepID=A0A223NZC7_9SPHI|nr:hypothetical protein MuYL_3245 [Mucilaginibacter xinganensis]